MGLIPRRSPASRALEKSMGYKYNGFKETSKNRLFSVPLRFLTLRVAKHVFQAENFQKLKFWESL
jgi:hypothetical protein